MVPAAEVTAQPRPPEPPPDRLVLPIGRLRYLAEDLDDDRELVHVRQRLGRRRLDLRGQEVDSPPGRLLGLLDRIGQLSGGKIRDPLDILEGESQARRGRDGPQQKGPVDLAVVLACQYRADAVDRVEEIERLGPGG